MEISIKVNGVAHSIHSDPGTSLLEVLRDELGLTGTKYGCGESRCGACTVLLDGSSTHSCVTSIQDAKDGEIVTIEGLAKNGKLDPIQQAFLDEGAMQCAYCVSGMIITARELLNKNPHPTREQVVTHMNGNLCRCGCYPRIVDAILRASGVHK